MAVELASDAVLLADVPLQVGYEPGSIGDVIEALSAPEIWLGAAAGGAFGAALGALPAFIFTGFLVLAGVFGGDAAAGVGVGLGFGPVFGPHISFAAGAAAAAYAAKKGILQSGFDYHNGKDITYALGSRPDILAVGAAFGLFGVALEQTLRHLAVPTDPIAFTVVASALLHRVVFGYSVIGVVSSKADGYFDMSPFEREDRREPGQAIADGGMAVEERLAVEPWLPNMYQWSHVATIGLFAGLASAYATLQTGSPFIGFGFSAATLLFLNLGVEKIPVTHHMTLPAGTVYLAAIAPGGAVLAGMSPGAAVAIAGVFGLLGALIGEAFQRIFYAHGDTHVDPPAASIFITHSLICLLVVLGIFQTAVWVPGFAG
ncbi:hypothetical protein SAMN05444422_11039 [Halobiforma haloterrestris]|uniref:DUF7973 domain-containing protein n=1 Tax=Natronobacterium haloterrestre TaxID=148448 RepID=A0A1I1K8N9_NATHA|nr:hypothetical protein [Halobiforma haloterrestris]SFC54493.1 hypothetical protein SAMN05444422_11039 [Halobiforma haloterrestris]